MNAEGIKAYHGRDTVRGRGDEDMGVKSLGVWFRGRGYYILGLVEMDTKVLLKERLRKRRRMSWQSYSVLLRRRAPRSLIIDHKQDQEKRPSPWELT